MHIIVLEPYPSSHRGGQEIALFDICRGLAERGYSITLLYCQADNLLQQYQEFCVHTIQVNKFFIYRPQDIFAFFADVQKVISQLPTTEDSLILSNQFKDTPFARSLAVAKNIPLVCYLHLPPPSNAALEWKWKSLEQVKFILAVSINRFMWNTGLKGVNHFIAVSQQTKLDWVQRGYPKEIIDVVYNGIDLEVYKKANVEVIRKKFAINSDTVISFVGRIDKEKGLETLIKALALLLKNGANTQLLIAGKPINNGEDYQKSLEQLVIDLGIEERVNFIGHVTDTTSVYQVSDLTVLPSLWSEPFGRTIVESMACGTPVVASRIGGIPEILTGEFQNGLFVAGNEQDLSTKLEQMINWRERDPLLGTRCREHILAKFSLSKMIDGIEKVLKKRFRPTLAPSQNPLKV